MDDTELRQKAHAGDQAAFTQLASQNYAALCRHATYLLQDGDSAEDIVQEALLKAYLRIRQYDPERSFSAWSYRIVTNCALDHLRRRKDSRLEDIDEIPADEENLLLNQEDAALRKEQIATLKKAITQLPGHYQAVVNLYYWEEKSYDEIAAIMQKPLGTIKIWLYRAKRQLKEACNG